SLLPGGGHAAGVADGTDERPKMSRAMINSRPYPAPTVVAAIQRPPVRRCAYGVPMSVAEEKPALDTILLKVLEAVPFQLTTDGGAEAARQRFKELPRMPIHPGLRVEDHSVAGPAGAIPIRGY